MQQILNCHEQIAHCRFYICMLKASDIPSDVLFQEMDRNRPDFSSIPNPYRAIDYKYNSPSPFDNLV